MAGTLVRSRVTKSQSPMGMGDLGVRNRQSKFALQIASKLIAELLL